MIIIAICRLFNDAVYIIIIMLMFMLILYLK
jgi:hypothetical protein